MPTKPPSREELAFEWMVGDAKEILAELEALKAEVTTMQAEQKKEHEAALAALVALNKDVVGSYRDFSNLAKKGISNIEEAAHAASKDMVKAWPPRTAALRRLRFYLLLWGLLWGLP